MDAAVSDVGEPAHHCLGGTDPALTELVAAADGRSGAQFGAFGVGTFHGTGLDHRQEMLCLPRPAPAAVRRSATLRRASASAGAGTGTGTGTVISGNAGRSGFVLMLGVGPLWCLT